MRRDAKRRARHHACRARRSRTSSRTPNAPFPAPHQAPIRPPAPAARPRRDPRGPLDRCLHAARGDDAPETGDQAAAPDESATAPAIQATNAFYYYRDVEAAWVFYRDVLGFETVADFGFAKILRVAPASYLTLVDETRGMHSADEPRSVTLAIVTEQVEGWWSYLSEQDVEMRAPLGEVEPGRAHDGFVAIDPEGYFLGWDTFLAEEGNERLVELLDAEVGG